MKVKDDNKEKFILAMVNLFRAFKNEADYCGKLCGGFNEKELIIIVFIGQNGNVKMSDIAATMDAPMSTLTTIVDKLVDKKHLHRDHSHEDRRVINVSLAPTGKAAYKIIMAQKKQVAEKLLSQFNEKEQRTIIQYMNELASSMGSEK